MWYRGLILGGLLFFVVGRLGADDTFPYRQQPVDYFSRETNDRIARLQGKLERGEVKLEFEPTFGYLRSVLKELEVPVESQLAVFSRTSLNVRHISPRTPHALYFDEEVAIGWVPRMPELELAAIDPVRGPIFYTLAQTDRKPLVMPRFQRDESCLQCHVSVHHTRNVPGWLSRSLREIPGKAGFLTLDQAVPVSDRWGQWYVTGQPSRQPHFGNLVTPEDWQRHEADPQFGGMKADLRELIDADKYPAASSDVVAHLVFQHQMPMQNWITRVGYEARFGRDTTSEEGLLRYLLFVDEAPLSAAVRGASGFAKRFQQQGPRDGRGRSLRDLQLDSRTFQYRCSYLIYSRSFDALPAVVKDRLYRRLHAILTAEQPAAPYDHLPAEERRAILEILRETKRDLPGYWR